MELNTRQLTAHATVFGGDGVHRFTYDALDNLRSWTLAGVKDYAQYTYDVNNRLASIQATGGATLHTMTHDVQGNLRTKDGTTYHFDVGNRLRAVVAPNVIETYRYDAHGRRVLAWTSLGNKLSMYASSGQLAYQQLWPTAMNKAVDYYYLSGSLVATRSVPLGGGPATVAYQHTDALGSPVAVTDALGAVVERTDFDPYGNPINKVMDGVGYTGHVMDARTELVYMQQRYYDSSIGRFLSVDAVPPDVRTGRNFSRYWYAESNPYNLLDPDGMYACEPKTCEATRKALAMVREAASATSTDEKTRTGLNAVLDFYGEEGVDNGVTVQDGDLEEGTLGTAGTYDEAGSPGGLRTIVTIDFKQIDELAAKLGFSSDLLNASSLIHEGDHGVVGRGEGYDPYSRDSLNVLEVRAYTLEARFFQAKGSDPYQLLNSDGSIDYSAVGRAADGSVEAYCSRESCR